YARQRDLDEASGCFGQQGGDRRTTGEANVAAVLGDGLDDGVRHLVGRRLDEDLQSMEALERSRCWPVPVDAGEHVRRDRTQLHDGRADRRTLEVGPQASGELGETRFG